MTLKCCCVVTTKYFFVIIVFQASIIAVVVPEEEELLNFAKTEGLEGDFKELCTKKASLFEKK